MNKAIRKMIISIAQKNPFLRDKLRDYRQNNKNEKLGRLQDEFELDEKMVLFEAYMGRNYTCNPRAIYEEMLKDQRFKDFTYVWAFKRVGNFEEVENLSRATLVKYGKQKYFESYAKAKYIVTNSITAPIGTLRDEQVYLQTWHGTPLKRLGYDLETEKGNATNTLMEIKKRYKREAEKINYMVSPSAFTTEKLKSTYNLEENNKEAKIIETGYPRNDFLYNYTEEDVKKIKENLGLNKPEYKNKKIILYAPTFRDNKHESGVGFAYDLGFDLDKLRADLEEDCVVLFRTHYLIASEIDLTKYEDFIIDAIDYSEINDLYIVADLLITDYSSVFFDYANLKKPMLFYMYDLKEYMKDIRGFYIDLDELPGDILTEEKDLAEGIKNSFREEYEEKHKEKYLAFSEKYNYLDDGKASKRVIEEILK